MAHLDEHHILYDLQHGFRKARSCDTQLVSFIHDLASRLDEGGQTDVVVMDFVKAFDKVSHRLLLHELDQYGIDGMTNSWIASFLSNCQQPVVLDGATSTNRSFYSGVPQGSVLGPILFLIYINDLPRHLDSKVSLFADNCIMYRNIRSTQDCRALQTDIDRLEAWETKWKMKFNTDKCECLRVTR